MEKAAQLDLFTLFVSLMAVVFMIAVGVVLLNLQFQKKMFRQQIANEELKNKHQLDLLQSSIAVQEGERKRIAEDLHDELGAILSISRMRLLQFQNTANDLNGEQNETLADIRSYIETSIASMRRISHELVPPQLEQFGLLKTLESVTHQLSKTNNLAVTINTNFEENLLSGPAQIGLYRVLMELINNTIKHAQAQNIQIKFTEDLGVLHCTYQDDGIGLPGNSEAKGLGFKNMESRIKALEGQLVIEEKLIKGFSISFQIPINRPNQITQ